MLDIRYITERIIRGVPCDAAGRAMGIHTDVRGRCKCPFHGGEHNNLKLYGEDRGFYCFVCHEHGNVINLVMKYKSMKYMDAVSWLNDTFGLGLDLVQKNYSNRRRKAEQYIKRKGLEPNGNTDTRWQARQAIAKRNSKLAGDYSQTDG